MTQGQEALQSEDVYDITIIGGGINGCGIAADASGRDQKVFLCEQGDIGSGTSSMSSKLIHGGLRYLEHYEFRLVREALAEREVLLAKAPNLVSPLKFTLPHRPHLRPAWMIRSGLFLYDHLSKRNSLPSAKLVDLEKEGLFHPFIKKGFEYYDCWVDDARLVIANALDAEQRGANIQVRTRCVGITFDNTKNLWRIRCENLLTGEAYEVSSKHVVNASGPWLNALLEQYAPDIKPSRNIRLIKGSHIVVPRVRGGDSAFILQNEDKRIVFVLPYQKSYSLIGTTDKEYHGDLNNVQIDPDELEYLLDVYNQHFTDQLDASDVVSSYSGVRPLCDDESGDPSAITRDYTIDVTPQTPNNALISIYGGKITTYRKLAKAVMHELKSFIPNLKPSWTRYSPLPGCIELNEPASVIQQKIQKLYPFLPQFVSERYARSYGHLSEIFLDKKTELSALGTHFGHGLYQAEVDYLIACEWVRASEDVLKRRTKLGLEYSNAEEIVLKNYIDQQVDSLIKGHTPTCEPA
jgi:glycerol-3-phosphate dehydrogenase